MENTLIPHLFRTEFSKIVSVLTKRFGLQHIEIAEDLVSDTFLLAAETWGLKGIPDHPTAWLYTVAKNKTKDYLKRHQLFSEKIALEIRENSPESVEMGLDLSEKNITDSQLQMMFALCHPSIPTEAQIGLSLRILCGFGIEEIADAFLSNKETINKRLFRAKEKLREEKIQMVFPPAAHIPQRLETVLRTLYLLFNEGYYSTTQNTALRKDLCLEAMRLTVLLTAHDQTNQPLVNALLSLMCFHASRFDARLDLNGELILYEAQDAQLWDTSLIQRGEYYLNKASTGSEISKYHLEAAIAYWHTQKQNEVQKWENILQLYNQLLQIDYSPMAALNRTYALARAQNPQKAIEEAEKLNLQNHHFYHALLGELYRTIDTAKSLAHYHNALQTAKTEHDRQLMKTKIAAFV
jgi:RNA polymerase sigma factor (sigma-70 family)